MSKYPLFVDLENKKVLIIGGGKVAAGKAKRMLPFTSDILVIAEDTDIDFVKVIKKVYSEDDIAEGDIIIAATGDPDTDEQIANEAKKRGKYVNVASNPDLGNFYMPATIKRGDVVIAVSTNGKSPALSRYLREEIEAFLPNDIERITAEMGRLRDILKTKVKSQDIREEIYKEILFDLIKEENMTDERINTIIDGHLKEIKC